MKGMICPGGLKKDIPTGGLVMLDTYLDNFINKFDKTINFIHRSDSVLDRLETTGVIRKELVNPLNLTGPAARASGAEIDTRADHPYGLYDRIEITKRTAVEGDVMCRFDVKAAEILDSIGIIQKQITNIKSSEIFTEPVIQDGCALSLVEAARGQNLHWVYIKGGVIERYKVRTASFCNWQAIEHAVMGDIVPDFPLINKSLNLSYAGTDL